MENRIMIKRERIDKLFDADPMYATTKDEVWAKLTLVLGSDVGLNDIIDYIMSGMKIVVDTKKQ